MLDYIALFIFIFAGLILFYGIIVIHDIPYEIAEKRQHPHADAIHIAGWVSLLTLHVLWPFLWIWSTLYRADRGWGFFQFSVKNTLIKNDESETSKQQAQQQLESLLERVSTLETELSQLKKFASSNGG